MYFSKLYIPTQKEIPADAVLPSHRLMLRAGLIRQLISGVYSYLPLGWRVIKKIMEIIREEMDQIGAQELHLPILNPIDIWEESGRNADFGDEMFRLTDRKKRSLLLAPTHEEVICDLARNFIHSYRDLPQIWYQIQTKFRDEPRPRSGVIRMRQFIMKDSYTLDADEAGLERSYQLHAEAYRKIFMRCGLRFHIVGASSGLMGGSGSQEFMVESESGEDKIVLCDSCSYASNFEVARSIPIKTNKKKASLQKIHTPDKKTITEVSEFLDVNPSDLMKSLMYVNREGVPILILLRGDHELNDAKLKSVLNTNVRLASSEEVNEICGSHIGFVGPIGLKKPVRIIADEALKHEYNLISGANEKDYHIKGIEIDRDCKIDSYSDIRNILQNERCPECSGILRIVNAIELGHIFKLGLKYSECMHASFYDSNGREKSIFMGSYGIGLERIIASFIEQNHDHNGIIWNKALSPFDCIILPLKNGDKRIIDVAQDLYNALTNEKFSVLIDDREVTSGIKFKDADLLGFPLKIIIGDEWLANKNIEIQKRLDGDKIFVNERNICSTIHNLFNETD